ncbi:disulfide bond formation protein B [Pseudooceanicola sp. C21-150M6]|uniref:disulfide bond formation protein B n=1 Tax=Pseudooceanicola sp. C21-150M6 TaxID=3434355 RepID=UPI003D7FB384
MNTRLLVLLASAGSLALLAGAFAFQYLGGLAPCHLCLLQRWPHAAAVLIGVIVLATRQTVLAWLGACAAATTAAIGLYHTGVERGWWEGPSSCTSSGTGGMTADQLFDQIMNAPLIRCDEVAWSLLGLSMASWNALIALVLTAIWILAAQRGRAQSS